LDLGQPKLKSRLDLSVFLAGAIATHSEPYALATPVLGDELEPGFLEGLDRRPVVHGRHLGRVVALGLERRDGRARDA
jgi:hypothetical protein